jgi:lipopolysaccharide/colanic/teichoic acid biosynthesis glycosyltransferase
MSGSGEEVHSAIQSVWVKRLGEELSPMTRLFALVALAIYLPIMVVAALVILMTSPGPAILQKAYRRSRGDQEIVYLYEFRTECWQTWRITPVGALLRAADLHRLPRLANVLLGEIAAGERVRRVGA